MGNDTKQVEILAFWQKKTSKLGCKTPDEVFSNSYCPLMLTLYTSWLPACICYVCMWFQSVFYLLLVRGDIFCRFLFIYGMMEADHLHICVTEQICGAG